MRTGGRTGGRTAGQEDWREDCMTRGLAGGLGGRTGREVLAIRLGKSCRPRLPRPRLQEQNLCAGLRQLFLEDYKSYLLIRNGYY